MGFFSSRSKAKATNGGEDAPMTPEQLEKLYPDCIAKMKDKWKAEQQAAPDPEDGNGDGGGDGGDGEPVDPPPSTEPEASGSESRATQSRATQQTSGSESRATQSRATQDNDESAEAGTGATVAAGGASARFVSQEVGTMANESNKAGAEKPGEKVANGGAASIQELRAKWPGDLNSAFVLDCLEKGLTMTQAMEARLAMLEGRNQQIEKDAAALNGGGVQAAIGGGVARAASQPIEAPGGNAAAKKSAAEAAYYAKVKELEAAGMPRYKAIHKVNTEYPELQEAAVAEARPDLRRAAKA